MFHPIRVLVIFIFFVIATLAPSIDRVADAAGGHSLDIVLVNRGVVELETGASYRAAGIAEDTASIINDGATRRVVPVIGRGPMQNLSDLKYLRENDLGVIQSDARLCT